jgi:hypothetical protein
VSAQCAGVRGQRDEVVLANKFVEFVRRKRVIPALGKRYKEEDALFSIEQVNTTGFRSPRYRLQEQNPLRHFDPARRMRFPDVQEHFGNMLNASTIAEANVGGCEQRRKPYRTSTKRHRNSFHSLLVSETIQFDCELNDSKLANQDLRDRAAYLHISPYP